MKRKLNEDSVAIYLPSLRGGGTERAMVTLANGFADRGLPVDMVLAKAEGPYLVDVSRGVRVVDLGVPRVLASLPGLMRYLRRERPAVLLSAMSHANIVAVVARRLSGSTTRLFVSERSHFSVLSVNDKSIPGRSLAHFMRWMYPATDGIVAVSRGVAEDLIATLGVPRSMVHALHNPVVTSRLISSSREALSHPWFSHVEVPVVLGVGRFTVEKDFPLLIRAFAKVRAERNIRLMILGDGELRAELEALVRELGLEDDVSLPGFVTNPYVYMRQAALFVLSSSCEGLPNALLEAMACGATVVATDCPSGPAEILEGGKWGRLVPVGDVLALACAISATLDDVVHPDTADRASDFGIDQAVSNYLSVLFADGVVDKNTMSVA